MIELIPQTIEQAAKQGGKAFYLLDSRQFHDNFIALQAAFRHHYANFQIAYSYKTNYIPQLCRIVNENGGYAEVVSEMELELALRIGVAPDRILWNGPIKNMERAKAFLLSGGTVNADSLAELIAVKAMADAHRVDKFHVGIRCNFPVSDGVISRFGIDAESAEFEQALAIFKETDNMELINLQCHFAKRDIAYWPSRAKGMLSLVDRAAAVLGYLPKRVDIGGGLYGRMAESLKAQFAGPIPTYADYAQAAAAEFAKHFPNGGPELVIEPGSALVGDCMHLAGRVESIKTVQGKVFATVFASQKNISMTGVNPPLTVVPFGKERNSYENVDLVGYTCIENDVLYHGYSGELAVGDYVVFSNCGSYSVVMKPPFILPNFPIFEIDGAQLREIKRGENFEDIFCTYTF